MQTPTGPGLSPKLLPLGLDGVLVWFAREASDRSTDAVLGFADALRSQNIAGLTEVATALASVLIRFDPEQTSRAEVEASVQPILAQQQAAAIAPKRRWLIPAQFGATAGPQLAEAAALAGVSPAQALADLAQTELRVLAIGFAPGQPYLGQLPPAWAIARQPQLTPMVPAGSLVVALRQLVLFGNDSTTGWRHVGRCAFRPFKLDRQVPFALQTGDAIRWVPVSDAEMQDLGRDPDGLGGARCEVLT